MTLETDFIDVLQADDELMALLPGGLFSAVEVGEISQQRTPSAFDENKELQACALVKMGNEIPIGPYPNSVQTPVQIFFYEKFTSDSIETAQGIAFDDLNYQKIGQGTWRVEFEGVSFNQADDVLDANLIVLRMFAVRLKQRPEGGS